MTLPPSMVEEVVQKETPLTKPASGVADRPGPSLRESDVRLREACAYAERLATVLWERHGKEKSPYWRPLSGDLVGLLMQIDNITSVLSLRTEAVPDSKESDPEQALLARCQAEGFDSRAGKNLIKLIGRAGLRLEFRDPAVLEESGIVHL